MCKFIAMPVFAQDFSNTFDTAKIRPSQPTQVVQKKSGTVKLPGPKPISKELSLGFRINTDGWGIFMDYGTSRPIDTKHGDRFYNLGLWQFEFTEKKNPREEKSSSGSTSNGSGSSSFIFGKINNFYVFKPGYGVRTMIAGKPDDQGAVSIHWVNLGGPAIGILKPYYLNVSGDPVAIKYSDATKTDFLDPNLVISSAGFGKGISESKVIPGVHFKSALHFDFTGNLRNVIAVETGVNAEYYFQDIQLMANIAPTNYFVDVYLSFQFGRRW